MTATAMPARTRPGWASVAWSAACRWRQSHHTSRPNDSASRASATTRAACINLGGTTPAAATVSTIPCVAATTFLQSRRGSGAAYHLSIHPATRNT